MAAASLPAEVQAAAARDGFSAAEYNRVAIEARLDTIQLVSLRLDTQTQLLAEDGECELAFDRKVLSCRFDDEGGSAAAIFQFTVSVRLEQQDAFGCTADYAVLYGVPEDARPEVATSFCKHVGSFAAYPYFRALAAQMAWNAGVDLPPLPTIAAMPIVPKPKAPEPPVEQAPARKVQAPGRRARRQDAPV
jgi:hypothetical protein